MPASKVSRISYSKRALRLLATSLRSESAGVTGPGGYRLWSVAGAVGAVDEDAGGLPAARPRVLPLHVAADDHQARGLDRMGGGAVHADLARAGLSLDRVGREPAGVGAVVDLDLLVGKDVRRAHQIGVDGDAPLVLDVRLGDGGSVDLRLQHGSEHGGSSSGGCGSSTRLSISRTASPPEAGAKRTASASSTGPVSSAGAGSSDSGSRSSA